jgi:hypothetical protein
MLTSEETVLSQGQRHPRLQAGTNKMAIRERGPERV